MGVVEGGGGGGGVDLALGFKNFWDGVYNFFFCPPLGFNLKKKWNTVIRSENIDFVYMLMEAVFCFPELKSSMYIFAQFAPYNLSTRKNEVANVL